MQMPRENVTHTDIIMVSNDVDVPAVRTQWPLGLPFRDFGAAADDAVDGRVKVCSLYSTLLQHHITRQALSQSRPWVHCM
jgi:hypothetical protein